MKKVKKLAELTKLAASVLCSWQGRIPDHECNPGEPQWRHYESQARVVINALNEAGKLK